MKNKVGSEKLLAISLKFEVPNNNQPKKYSSSSSFSYSSLKVVNLSQSLPSNSIFRYVIAVHYDRPSTPWSWVHMLANLTNQPYLYKNGKLVDGSGPSIASAYMSALYYCMSSLTTCGFGNIAPNTTAEKLFGCVTMLLGCK